MRIRSISGGDASDFDALNTKESDYAYRQGLTLLTVRTLQNRTQNILIMLTVSQKQIINRLL